MSPWRQYMLLSRGRSEHLSSSKASFLPLGGDWNCVAQDLDLVGGQPGTRQHGFQSGLLPFQQALSLQDAFRCLHPPAREFTHTATNNASSARIDRWLVSDSLLPNVSAASVTYLMLSDHYGVAVSVSPPRGPGLWSMPPAIISHPDFKALMTAQIQTFLQANPVTTTLSRAARWDKLKVDIQDVARNYCSTFHAQRTGYEPARLEQPMWQLEAVIMPWMHCAIWHQISCSIAGSRLPQMPCGLGSCCMSMGISPPTISITCTGSGSKLQSLLTCSSSKDHQ